MPDFFVKSKTGRTYLSDVEQYEQQLNEIAGSISAIQNNLSFQVLSRAYISSQMNSIIHNIEINSQKMKSLRSSLEESMNSYEDNELKIIAHTMGIDVGKLKELMNSSGNGNSPEDNKSIVEKLLFGDYKADAAILGGSVAGTGSFLGAATSGTLTGNLVGGEAELKRELEWDLDKGDAKAVIKGEATGYLAKGEAEGSWGYLSGSGAVSVGTAAVSGEAGLTLFDDGKFDPAIYANAEASASALSGEAEAQFGSEDYNVHVAGEGQVLEAEASAGFELDSDGVHAKAEVGAAVAKGEVSGGFTIFGVKVDLTAEGEALGIGAGAEFRAEKDSFELGGKLSFLAGLGLKLKISW